jgi:hypothetical protein
METESSLFSNTTTPLKIVVFDLDETLGYFSEFGMFWSAIGLKTQQEFNDTLDLYPEFIRPDIINILSFLMQKKQTNHCNHIMIYTNNQGPKEWAVFIKLYFEYKTGGVVFDKIIAAFKVNGKQIEIGRTTHNKTHQDFIKCTKVPKNSQICFLDDVYHPEMKNNNVYYINIKPYVHDLSYETLIERYIKKHPAENTPSFISHCQKHLSRYNHTVVDKNPEEYEIDKILTKQILHHIRLFFNHSKTRRHSRSSSSRVTAKNRG